MKSNQSYCLGGGHYSRTVNQNLYEKGNPKTGKVFKIIKSTCSLCGRKTSQIFTK